MTMIADGDETVRNAFRAILREEPSRAAVRPDGSAFVLEVGDLAGAIEAAFFPLPALVPAGLPSALADDVLADASLREDEADGVVVPPAAPSSDIFEGLGLPTEGPQTVPTDDCIGPATPHPSAVLGGPPLTPVPPRLLTPLPPVAALAAVNARTPLAPSVDVAPRPRLDVAVRELPAHQVEVVDETGRLLGTVPGEDELRARRLRALVGGDLEASDLIARLDERRTALVWMVVILVVFLALLAASAAFVQQTRSSTVSPSLLTQREDVRASRAAREHSAPPNERFSSPPRDRSDESGWSSIEEEPNLPVVDVKSLPPAGAR